MSAVSIIYARLVRAVSASCECCNNFTRRDLGVLDTVRTLCKRRVDAEMTVWWCCVRVLKNKMNTFMHIWWRDSVFLITNE